MHRREAACSMPTAATSIPRNQNCFPPAWASAAAWASASAWGSAAVAAPGWPAVALTTGGRRGTPGCTTGCPPR
eukprot:7641129-Lingulodinium_polyedra.AAC.1